jgi:hypothetical protein
MSLLVLFEGGVGVTAWPVPYHIDYEIRDTGQQQEHAIPDAASRMILFSGDADWIYGVDIDVASGTSGDGRLLRQDEERWVVLDPGVNRFLRLRCTTASAVITAEYL